MTKGKWVTIKDGEYGEGESKRINLASLTVIWEGNEETGTGTFRTAIYLMPRAKRVLVENYSIWENPRTHGCYGTSYRFADAEMIAKLADDTGDERLMALVPELVDATDGATTCKICGKNILTDDGNPGYCDEHTSG